MFWKKEPKTKFLVCITKEKQYILLFTQQIFLEVEIGEFSIFSYMLLLQTLFRDVNFL